MPDVEIITTEDGSHTLRHTTLQETYHSIHGALRESLHVFIECGLAFRDGSLKVPRLRILEIGFGTGLNALLALEYSIINERQVEYTTLEPYPLPPEVALRLNYPTLMQLEQAHFLFQKLHASKWEEKIPINHTFELIKRRTTLQDWKSFSEEFDVIFFDAFAPSRQPEIWQRWVLEKLVIGMKAGAVFVTYSAMGQLKRDLRDLGLVVETLPGPPGKKEMVRGKKPG